MKREKKIRITLYTIIILAMALVSQVVVNNLFRNEGRIADAFHDTNMKVEESKLEFAIDYGSKFLSQEDKKALIDFIASSIGLEKNYVYEEKQGNHSASTLIKKEGKYADTLIEIISLTTEKDSLKEVQQFILITLRIHKNTSGIVEYKDMLESTIKKIEIVDYQSMIQLKGTYSGNLALEEKDRVASTLLKSLQANVVEERKEEDMYNIYAYTGLIKEYIKLSNQKVNINVTMTYDEIKDETNVLLASPILNEDY